MTDPPRRLARDVDHVVHQVSYDAGARATYDTSVVPDREVVTCLGCIAGRLHAS